MRSDHLMELKMKPKVKGIVPELTLVKGGKLAYIWIGDGIDGCYATISGPRTLRKLAQAILDEVPA